MLDRGRHNVLGVRIDAVDYEAAIRRVLVAAREGRRCTVSALAVHGVMTGARDPEHRYRLNHLDLVVPDGQPVRWALNWLHGTGLDERVYGPELTLRLCEAAATNELPVYFYGSRRETLKRLTQRLGRHFPALRIAGAEPSKFRRLTPEEKPALIRRIHASGARVLFVGLGCPRQEVFAYEFGDALEMPVLAVGAAFDFHAGTLRQAPSWMQRRGLEWLYRWFQEPRRLAHRYLVLNPFYLFLLGLQRAHLRSFDPRRSRRPTRELLYA